MQTARHLVAVVVELAAGVQHGHDHLRRRNPFFVRIDRDAPSVVTHADGLIGVDGDVDIAAIAGEGFVDRVVDNFKDHVVEASTVIGVTDVHTGTLTHRIKALQNLNTR